MTEVTDSGTVLALDIGTARIGVAIANGIALIPHPVGAVANDQHTVGYLKEICDREQVTRLVIGIPRNLDGQETAQTAAAQNIGLRIARELNLPFNWQDEAVTSVQAEAELKTRGGPYGKSDIDALAATYILEDYLRGRL